MGKCNMPHPEKYILGQSCVENFYGIEPGTYSEFLASGLKKEWENTYGKEEREKSFRKYASIGDDEEITQDHINANWLFLHNMACTYGLKENFVVNQLLNLMEN